MATRIISDLFAELVHECRPGGRVLAAHLEAFLQNPDSVFGSGGVYPEIEEFVCKIPDYALLGENPELDAGQIVYHLFGSEMICEQKFQQGERKISHVITSQQIPGGARNVSRFISSQQIHRSNCFDQVLTLSDGSPIILCSTHKSDDPNSDWMSDKIVTPRRNFQCRGKVLQVAGTEQSIITVRAWGGLGYILGYDFRYGPYNVKDSPNYRGIEHLYVAYGQISFTVPAPHCRHGSEFVGSCGCRMLVVNGWESEAYDEIFCLEQRIDGKIVALATRAGRASLILLDSSMPPVPEIIEFSGSWTPGVVVTADAICGAMRRENGKWYWCELYPKFRPIEALSGFSELVFATQHNDELWVLSKEKDIYAFSAGGSTVNGLRNVRVFNDPSENGIFFFAGEGQHYQVWTGEQMVPMSYVADYFPAGPKVVDGKPLLLGLNTASKNCVLFGDSVVDLEKGMEPFELHGAAGGKPVVSLVEPTTRQMMLQIGNRVGRLYDEIFSVSIVVQPNNSAIVMHGARKKRRALYRIKHHIAH